jgi:dihydrofolate reductase
MRQLINSTYITLDGVIEGPHLWPPLPAGHSDEGGTIQTDLLETCDIVLMGRRTYDSFAPAWTARSGDPYSDRINTMRKLVVSTTLRDPSWANTEVIAGDVVSHVRDLKAEDGGHIVQYGIGDVTRLLLDNGLVDRLDLWIHPQIVGPEDAADLLWRPGRATAFQLVDSQVLSNGIILATYRP